MLSLFWFTLFEIYFVPLKWYLGTIVYNELFWLKIWFFKILCGYKKWLPGHYVLYLVSCTVIVNIIVAYTKIDYIFACMHTHIILHIMYLSHKLLAKHSILDVANKSHICSYMSMHTGGAPYAYSSLRCK